MKNSKANILSRQDELLTYLLKNRLVELSDMAEHFGVSPATIRRDIASLKECGNSIQCYGGVCMLDKGSSLPMFDDESYFTSHVKEKEAIAKKAAEFIDDGDSVFMNSSSTAYMIIPHIKKGKSVTIITNNGRSLLAERNPGIELIIIGGEVTGNPISGNKKLSMTGSLALEMISRISATKCILGVSGISADGGLTSMAVQDPAINSSMIDHCTGAKIVVADHRKIGIRHNFYFGKISDITHLITDSGSDMLEIEKIRSAGIGITIVDP